MGKPGLWRIAGWIAVVAMSGVPSAAADKAVTWDKVPYPDCRYVASSPDGKYLASVHFGSLIDDWHGIHLWRRSAARELQLAATLTSVPRHCSPYSPSLSYLAFSPDSRMLATRHPDDSTTVWETATGKERLRLNTQGIVVAFGADSRTVIAVSRDGLLQHWDLATGKCVAPADTAERDEYLFVTDAVASADGSRVALTDGYSILFKDARSGKTIRRVNYDQVVRRPELAANGRTYTVNGDRYNLATGIMLGRDWRFCQLRKPVPTPLEAKIVSRQDAYALDLQGKTPQEYARLVRQESLPPSPGVDLLLTLRNTSRETVVFYPDLAGVYLHLVGPGALNHPERGHQTGIGVREAKEVALAPGQTFAIPIRSLDCGYSLQSFWVLPGEYTVHATCHGFWYPPRDNMSEEEVEAERIFGFRGIQPPPLRLKVVAGKK